MFEQRPGAISISVDMLDAARAAEAYRCGQMQRVVAIASTCTYRGIHVTESSWHGNWDRIVVQYKGDETQR